MFDVLFIFCTMSTGMSEKDKQVMKKLMDSVNKQRDEIRARDHELTLKNEDVDAVRVQTSCSTYSQLTSFSQFCALIIYIVSSTAPDAAAAGD